MSKINLKGFDSFDLLTSVDQLDAIRYILSDSGDLRPPKVRQDLMELHGAVFAASNGFDSYGLEQIKTKLDEVQSVIETVQYNSEQIWRSCRICIVC